MVFASRILDKHMINFPTNIPKNFLRLGVHGEQKYFVKYPELFGGITLNGTIVALSPGATGIFLGTKMLPQKEFFVDPLTYAFERSPIYIMREDGEVKRSIKKLVDFFGEPLKSSIGKRALTPDQFKDSIVKKEFCQNVISFQKNVLEYALSDDLKYLDPATQDISSKLKPAFIIPPYFYLDITSWKYWIDYNINFTEIALEVEKEKPIFCEIILGRELLHQPDILFDKLALRYKKLKCNGFLIWINDFPEYKTTEDEIVNLRKFIKHLAETERPIINLYGGYLSALLFFDGLSGFCHGPGYGEDRDIVPVGGGLPYPKFYFTPLHRRILAEQVDLFIKLKKLSLENYYSNICDCNICKSTIQNSLANFYRFAERVHIKRSNGLIISYASEKAKILNNFHYLHARHKEIMHIGSTSKEELLSELRKAEKEYLPFFSTDWVSHLKIWYDALSKNI